MKNIKEKSLIDVLSFCDLRELPQEDDKEFVWIRAIGLVEKINGTHNYVLLKKDEENNYFVAKDFGTISSISKIEKIFPFDFLDADYLPDFNGKKKEDRILWLQKNGVRKEISSMTVKELDKECIKLAVKKQLNKKI